MCLGTRDRTVNKMEVVPTLMELIVLWIRQMSNIHNTSIFITQGADVQDHQALATDKVVRRSFSGDLRVKVQNSRKAAL